MAVQLRPEESPPSFLEIHFGARADLAQRIIDVLDAAPFRIWRAADLITAARIGNSAEGYMLLARLTRIRAIAHPELGVYAAADTVAKAQTA